MIISEGFAFLGPVTPSACTSDANLQTSEITDIELD